MIALELFTRLPWAISSNGTGFGLLICDRQIPLRASTPADRTFLESWYHRCVVPASGCAQ